MDRQEAAQVLRRELTGYARRPRAELVSLVGDVDAYSVAGPSSARYQIEVDAHWDDEPGGTLRVLGSIDDGGLRSGFSPTTDGFLIDADGVVDIAELEVPG